MPFAPLIPAALALDADGTPYSALYQDIYHSADGGPGQARHVFVGGNDLPQRWSQSAGEARKNFVILETGFGMGLNFLATWAAWDEASAAATAMLASDFRLHYIAFEKHPFSAADLSALHQAWPELAERARLLREMWPPLLPGWNRLFFADERIVLDLFFGDALTALPQLPESCKADAFYLDGFAPANNPDLWSAGFIGMLSSHAAPGASLATWSVAAKLRAALEENGWRWRKAEGFAGKREMLCAARVSESQPATVSAALPSRRAIVIGAGAAGTSAAERLAARGWEIELIDEADAPGQGASGNHAGVFRPLPSADDNRLARLTRAAFLYTSRHLAALQAEGLPARWGATGVLHLARDAWHESVQRRVVEEQKPPADYLCFLETGAASERAGWPLANGGWWFPGGAWVMPPSLCRANLLRHAERIRTHFRRHARRIEYAEGEWRVFAVDKETGAEEEVYSAPTLVLANAADARRLIAGFEKAQGREEKDAAAWLPLFPARGQVTHLPAGPEGAPDFPPRVVVCRLGYVTPAVDGRRCAGATFIMRDEDPELREADHRENLAKLDFILPGYSSAVLGRKEAAEEEAMLPALSGRVGFRPAAPDRLPFIGPVPDASRWSALPDAGRTPPLSECPRLPGLWLCNGFGARGLVWSAWAGEILASQITGIAPPLEQDLLDALDPARFLNRRRQGKNSKEPQKSGE